MHKNRREFLKGCCALGATGLAANLTRLGLLSSASAQSAPNYKALVCVFFFGGNDANNMIVPIDSRYSAYQAMRSSVAMPQANLLPAGGSGFGLHPALVNVQNFYNQQRAAFVFNVGTLVRPTSRTSLNSTPLPRNLYSHSDQVQQWQTSDPNGGSSGWGGRINDIAGTQNTGALPPGISVNGGNSLFLSGPITKGLNFSNAESFGLDTFGEGSASKARLAALQKILTFDSGLRLVTAANGVLTDSIASAKDIDAALNTAPALPVTFPNSSLGQQLSQVARIISARDALGMKRQIFFAGLGGFDNHEDLVNKQQQLLATVDAAFGAFLTTLELTGMLNNVTLFTESDFNRTGNANANVGMLENLTLRARNVGMRVEDESVDGWWLDLSAKRLAMWNTDPPRAEGSVSIRSKNLAPVLEALAEKDVISDVIPVLTRLDDFRAKSTFRTVGKTADVTLESESDVWDVSGRAYSSPKQNLMAMVVGGQAVSVGIAQMGDGLQIRPFAKTDWLNARLAQFPKPLVQMAPAKP